MHYAMHNPSLRPRHSGITLIEVMMSAMVVSLGILGLVALIPLGTHLTERGTRSDRVASNGERGFHDAKTRGYLNPASWVSPVNSTNLTTPHLTGTRFPVRQPYLIDPWFFPDNFNDGNRRFFPASQQYAVDGGPVPMRMHRMSLRAGPGVNVKMPRRQAAINFMSEDDLSVERPSDGTLPPIQSFFTRQGDGGMVPVRRQAQGDFTWMLMLVPDIRNIAPQAAGTGVTAAELTPPMEFGGSPARQTLLNNNVTDDYNLSVIVMQRRQPKIPLAGDLDGSFSGNNMLIGANPSERVLQVNPATFANTDGYSTGEVRLQINSSLSVENDEAMLSLSNSDWICLAGRVQVNGYPAGDVYQWYRVSSVSEIFQDPNNGMPSIDVTFTGPDWSAGSPPAQAIVVEGVVGVYTKRVRLDTSAF